MDDIRNTQAGGQLSGRSRRRCAAGRRFLPRQFEYFGAPNARARSPVNLIAILVALALEHWSIRFHPRHYLDWLPGSLKWSVKRLGRAGDGPIGVIVVLVLPSLAVAGAHYVLQQLSPLLGLVFGTLVLAACLKGHDLGLRVNALRAMLARGDEEGARVEAAAILGYPVHSTGDDLLTEIAEGIVVEANECVFAVLFWFVLLGPVGALVYRLSGTLDRLAPMQNTHFFAAASRFHWVLGWLPARISALAYAAAGSFGHAMQHRSADYGDSGNSNTAILSSTGMGALLALEPQQPDDFDLVREAKALVVRAVAVWVTAAALYTLGS